MRAPCRCCVDDHGVLLRGTRPELALRGLNIGKAARLAAIVSSWDAQPDVRESGCNHRRSASDRGGAFAKNESVARPGR
jgi:hypothetical protein